MAAGTEEVGITSTKHYAPSGIVAAVVTPFHDDESLDEDRLASHLEFLIASGVHGLMVVGGSGEYVNLTPAERTRVVTVTMRTVGARLPVIVGALAPSTREVLDIGLHAAKEGAAALLVLPPYYIKPSMDGVVTHYQKVARETGMNIVAYNNPGRTGWPMSVDQVRTIAGVDGVVGLKECDRDVASISLKIAAVGERIAVLSGDDDLGFATLLSGSPGAIWASPNLTPRLCLDLYAACRAGDVTTALALHNRLVQIVGTWFVPNHPGPLKEAMALIGRPVGRGRRPLAPMTPAQRGAMEDALRVYGPIE